LSGEIVQHAPEARTDISECRMIVAVGKEDVFVVGIKPIQAVQQAADVRLAAADDVRQQPEEVYPNFHVRFTIRRPPINGRTPRRS
jgi:hypothetical protein